MPSDTQRLIVIAVLSGLAVGLAACANSSGNRSIGGRYVDPMTCEIRNGPPGPAQYDPDCIKAAQGSAAEAAKAAARKGAKK
jgi:hypothetical protein